MGGCDGVMGTGGMAGLGDFSLSCAGGVRGEWGCVRIWTRGYTRTMKPVRTPVAIFWSLGVCIYVPASRQWVISYSPINLT